MIGPVFTPVSSTTSTRRGQSACVHLLVIDLFPPTKRDPFGVHRAIWDEFEDEDVLFEFPPGKDRILASYDAGREKAAYVEPIAVGDVLPELGIVSDGSAIYDMFVHGLCWIHQERNLAKLTPCGSDQSQALAEVLTTLWQLYADLKAYRLAPTPGQADR